MTEKYNQERRLYEDSVNAYRDIVNAIRTAEKKKFAEDRAEGRAEGIIEVAKSMIKKGMSVELISEVTGLSHDEIQRI